MVNEFDKQRFAKRIREIRKAKGLTQEEICDMTGIEVSNYSKIETGKVAPSMVSLQRLISFAGFVPNELFEYNHFDIEENLDKKIAEMYAEFSVEQKQLLYKIIKSIKEYK